jgi:hypothetical protein
MTLFLAGGGGRRSRHGAGGLDGIRPRRIDRKALGQEAPADE